MRLEKVGVVRAILIYGLAAGSLFAPNAYAQQRIPTSQPGATTGAPRLTTDRSLTFENEKVQTSAEHLYNSPAERAHDDLLITEVKSSLAEKDISDGYPVVVDCDHGTIDLSGVVASADTARQAALIASNAQGVIAVKNKLTWR